MKIINKQYIKWEWVANTGKTSQVNMREKLWEENPTEQEGGKDKKQTGSLRENGKMENFMGKS